MAVSPSPLLAGTVRISYGEFDGSMQYIDIRLLHRMRCFIDPSPADRERYGEHEVSIAMSLFALCLFLGYLLYFGDQRDSWAGGSTHSVIIIGPRGCGQGRRGMA